MADETQNFTQTERDLCERAVPLNSFDEYRTWERRCDDFIENLENRSRSKRPGMSVGHGQSLIARIARLEGLKQLVRARFVHTGAGDGIGSSEVINSFIWRKIDTAFRDRVLTGAVINRDYIEPLRFLEDACDTVLHHVRDVILRLNSVKVNTSFNGEFISGEKTAIKTISTKNYELYYTSDLQEWYEKRVQEPTLASLEEFQERDSGWALSRILNLTININKLNPMHAGCRIKMLAEIMKKRAVINVQSYDNACFAWAVVAALYPADRNTARMSSYPHYTSVLNLDGITFPMCLKQIGRFERLNRISINVYGAEQRPRPQGLSILPIHLTNLKMEKHVNLLYVQEDSQVEGHFVCIKNLSRLVGRQLSKHLGRKYICDRCLHYFSSDDKLQSHTTNCREMNDCAILLNEQHLKFDNLKRTDRVPFVIYADLECILQKIANEEEEEKEDEQKAEKYQHHKVFSVAFYTRCSYDDSLSTYHSYRGDDCVSWFVEELKQLALRVAKILSTIVPMVALTEEQREAFDSATQCHICDKPLTSNDTRVRDHCHLTGRYRGPAHSTCNIQYSVSRDIPVIFHNLSGYDAHFIIREIATAFDGSVNVLPITKEKYISFSKNIKYGENRNEYINIRFLDSYRFLNASLDKLASLLTEDKLKILRSEFIDTEHFNLLTRKGVFPYEYVDCADKLRETSLPPRESWYSSLTDDTVSESDYAHAANVWEQFAIRTLGEYSDLYLKIDVLLLADTFENFRDRCIASYKLDPAHYYTLPGYTWDAMLKYTGITFELLTDVDMVLFVERGIRGGLSQCSRRYARANNKYMQTYDPSKPSSYLMYFDVNNLYGWAMCQPLPYAEFRWVEDISNFDVSSVSIDSPVGYILEVDLEYPQHLHDAHADLPFCPTRDKPPGKRQEKLLATVCDKTRYIIHYRNLQQCMRHGLRVTRIHRVLQFAQSPWLRKYINLNTEQRTHATNDFEKNLFKLMNNAVFGKTMENVRNHVDVKLCTEWEGRYGAEAMIAKPNFHSRSVFAENLIAVELRRLEVKLNKPIYVGMCILDISKTCLYEFHHEHVTPLYGAKCAIMYTDTDSLIYHIECEDAYEGVKRNIGRFDTSDYAVDNAYGMPLANKKIPGLMKDENNGAIMTEFVGLRSKMYAIRVEGKNETKKIKGVKGSVVAKTITFDDYVRCLNEQIEMKRQQCCIRSALHEVYTVRETKIALSPHDDKRYIMRESSYETLPWGHYKIPL